MERNEGEGMQANTAGEEASFGSEVSSGGSNRVRNVASAVRDKASNLPSIIADGLEAGAQKLRQQKSALAGADGSSAVAQDSSIAAVTDTLATGMQSSAEWLRDADIGKIKSGVEAQVKEHPARTLLIALGAGYILGKAFRR